jgi:site-specific recombinase
MIQSILQAHLEKARLEGSEDNVVLLAEIVDAIRPDNLNRLEDATHALQAFCFSLNDNKAYVEYVRTSILTLIKSHRPVSIFTDSGIQPSSGFFSEIRRRISHKILPEVVDSRYLKDVFGQIFTKTNDEKWVSALPDEIWLQLIDTLHFEESDTITVDAIYHELLEAAQILSYRLSAGGLEPELIQNHKNLEKHDSPFIAQNLEISAVVDADNTGSADVSHVLIILEQCREVIAKIRKNSAQTGTSIRLTFLLQRMTQQLNRLETLFSIIIGIKSKTCIKQPVLELLKKLVHAECHKNDIRQHVRENVELIALRVTENASRTGEHYIAENRSEYFKLMRSAMGAGVIVGVMAMIKIMLAKLHLPPLTEAILFSLNYGIGFVIIHMLHFTVATKQPAMTAATIAATIDQSDGKDKNLDRLVTLIAQTMRSQVVAIVGNVMLALPVAICIGWLIHVSTGEHFISPEKAHRLLAELDPFHSAALMYAAVAGVCLFLAGLIAGYHDNLAIYNKIPQRIMALSWLEKLLGPARLKRLGLYIENNFGAIAGNFYFGCLLGGMAAVGVLLGLPIDIRHITFSSAFVGFTFESLDFAITWRTVWLATASIILIGIVNLLVSFSLALYVAMKSRKVTFAQWRTLIKQVLIRLNQRPAEFLFPPKKESRLKVEQLTNP